MRFPEGTRFSSLLPLLYLGVHSRRVLPELHRLSATVRRPLSVRQFISWSLEIVKWHSLPGCDLTVRTSQRCKRRSLKRPSFLPSLLCGQKARSADASTFPKSARVVGSDSSGQRMSRRLYHGLHFGDFPWLYTHRPDARRGVAMRHVHDYSRGECCSVKLRAAPNRRVARNLSQDSRAGIN